MSRKSRRRSQDWSRRRPTRQEWWRGVGEHLGCDRCAIYPRCDACKVAPAETVAVIGLMPPTIDSLRGDHEHLCGRCRTQRQVDEGAVRYELG